MIIFNFFHVFNLKCFYLNQAIYGVLLYTTVDKLSTLRKKVKNP